MIFPWQSPKPNPKPFQFIQRFQEKSARMARPVPDAEMETFVRGLWKAFPTARSENDLADKVAREMAKAGLQVHERTVRNWLRKNNTPHFRFVVRAMSMLSDTKRNL